MFLDHSSGAILHMRFQFLFEPFIYLMKFKIPFDTFSLLILVLVRVVLDCVGNKDMKVMVSCIVLKLVTNSGDSFIIMLL